mgnify:CR=1 FL=1
MHYGGVKTLQDRLSTIRKPTSRGDFPVIVMLRFFLRS